MKISNVHTSPSAMNWGLLLFRVSLGALMIVNHGWMKIVNYETLKIDFMSFLGLGSQFSLILAITAEILCSILLIFG
ncbi:MAG: DoxX family protein, partial [Myroides sp.]|nr:DoxX family protein [Myroides sp.]